MFLIEEIVAREVLDSRGNPTVEVDCALDRGRGRHRAGALGRLDRQPRGARAARRRHALPRQGRGDRGRLHLRRDRPRARGDGRPRPGAHRSHDVRPRRHAEQGAPRRQRHSRRLAGGGQGGGGGGGPAALQLPRRTRRDGAAGADAERPERRRPRRQLGRHPGVHDRADRLHRATARRCGPGSRSTTR